VCVLTPEISEGPFYFPLNMVRSDITEGKAGMPLKIAFSVLDAATCQPIKGAMIDFWQADATGNYSGYDFETAMKAMRGPFGPEGPPHAEPTNKLTFLRGISVSDSEGLAGFKSIYPGWYDHRAVHIHIKARIDGHVVHTGQIFFPDDVTDAVFGTSLYAEHTGQRVLNKDDVLYRNGGQGSTFAVQPDGDKSFSGSIILGVKRV
jgi:protocatechuate 3,4-dioxygenase beta subunit